MIKKKWITINTDWFQQTSQSHARFCIEQQNASWVFQVHVDKKPIVHPLSISMTSQHYYEGLWEYDVAEWFIVNLSTGKYVEWNLAPTGAWWMMAFDAPRQRITDAMPDLSGVTTSSHYDETSWSASLQCPASLLDNVLASNDDANTLKHNVCFILGQQPREYLSWTKLSARQPDFHRPAEFVAVLTDSQAPTV